MLSTCNGSNQTRLLIQSFYYFLSHLMSFFPSLQFPILSKSIVSYLYLPLLCLSLWNNYHVAKSWLVADWIKSVPETIFNLSVLGPFTLNTHWAKVSEMVTKSCEYLRSPCTWSALEITSRIWKLTPLDMRLYNLCLTLSVEAYGMGSLQSYANWILLLSTSACSYNISLFSP